MSPRILIFIVGFCTDLHGLDTFSKRNVASFNCSEEIKACYESGKKGKENISQPLSYCMSKHVKGDRK